MSDTPKKKRIEESEQVVDEKYEYITKLPDGGYGWVIAITAMLCNLVCDGTLFTFDSMKFNLQKHFGCSDMIILLAVSAPCGIYLLVGPIVSVLSKRYSFRLTIIIGSIGSAACTFILTMSRNLMEFIIIHGIIGSVFFCMVYLSSIVVISFYFDKKRAIVNGFVMAGGNIGALIFYPWSKYVMETFGWQRALLTLAFIMLTCILFGTIMKPLKPERVPIQRTDDIIKTKPDLTTASSTDDANMPSSFYNHAMNTNDQINAPDVSNLIVTSSHGGTNTISPSRRPSSNANVSHLFGVPYAENACRPLDKKDVLFTGSKQQFHTSQSNTYAPSMINFSILKNWQMLLIYIGNVFSMVGYGLSIVNLVLLAVYGHGLDIRSALRLRNVFEFFYTLGLLSGGFMTMIPHLSALRVHNTFLFIAGIVTVLAAYANNFITLALYAGVFGFAIAPHASLLLSVICDCAGLDRYITAISVLLLVRGVSKSIGVFATDHHVISKIGYFVSYRNSYNLAFMLGGAMIIISAFLHMCLSRVQLERLQEKKVVEKEMENIDV
ncbi:unnamed protein product [Rotaria socialis]|uniref:Monocarboxylate transporter n=1 Tax=Rotaria socialis TaxID=392032 RepID=A0A821HFV0_9BILA|nr:unnamed protein product [Rotaria socialis]CAF4684431.1 unnamed protein product [Rotaria socialis]